MKFGATNRYPFGKVDAEDDGEIKMGIAADHRNGIIRMEFGHPVVWLGLPAQHARELAKILIEKADELDKRKA